jgi:hypothetical protein
MADRSTVLGGAAVVLLSGVAAFVGAKLAQREPSLVSEPAPATNDDAYRARIDRALENLSARLGIAEENARTALEISRRNEEALRGGAQRPVGAAPSPGTPESPTAPSRPVDPIAPKASEPEDKNDGADGQMARLRAIHHDTARGKVVYDMGLFSDATEEGASNRVSQANADARSLMNMLGMKGEDAETTIRKVFQEWWDEGARDIGPMVHDGLEKADVATVKDRLHKLQGDADRKLRDVLDDKQWTAYQTMTNGARAMTDKLLDEFQEERLSGKPK